MCNGIATKERPQVEFERETAWWKVDNLTTLLLQYVIPAKTFTRRLELL